MESMDDTFKLAVFSKLKKINHLIRDITIGPDSLLFNGCCDTNVEPQSDADKIITNTEENKKIVNHYNKYCSNSLPSREFVKLLDLDRQRNLQDCIKERLRSMEEFQKIQIARKKENEIKRQETLFNKIKNEEMQMQKKCQEFERKLAVQQAALTKQIETTRQEIKVGQVQGRRRKKLQENVETFMIKYQEILENFNNFEYREYLKYFREIDLNVLDTLYLAMQEIEQKYGLNNSSNSIVAITEIDLDTSNEIVANLQDFNENLQFLIYTITERLNEQTLQNLQENVEVANDLPDPLHSGDLSEVSENVDTCSEILAPDDNECIDAENLIYENSEQNYIENDTENTYHCEDLGENFSVLHNLGDNHSQNLEGEHRHDTTSQEIGKNVTADSIQEHTLELEDTNGNYTSEPAYSIQNKINISENVNEVPVEHETPEKATSAYEAVIIEDKENSFVEEGKNVTMDVTSELAKLSKYVNFNDLHNYTEILDYLGNYRKKFENLENDARLKDFVFDLKKAVNIPVNSLSDANPQHIKDKYQKLYDLLSGGKVYINRKEICAAHHPEAIAFCVDLLAKKIVLQGDLMVSCNPKSAFCYASLVLTLWNDFPDFGKILLAYFYIMCPYLVPYYIPREVNQTDEEFYRKLGYQYIDGEVEKQDKFLKRMKGIMTLYFAILISKPLNRKPSPQNIRYAWKWIASFLRLEPQMDISATALCVFLETAGDYMSKVYGRVFDKVIKSVIVIYYPKCCEAKCTGGAITKLELLLKEYSEEGHFTKFE